MGENITHYFDQAAWSQAIRQLDWYVRLGDEYEALMKRVQDSDEEMARAIKDEVRGFFEAALEAGEVALAEQGDDMDEQRRPVDTVVIHHTSAAPGYTLPRMNTVHLLNLYWPQYLAWARAGEPEGEVSGIWSGHFDGRGRQVFYAYHWLVRMDGSSERLLADDEIGWQAGNWEVNTQSVGICLDNDYTSARPSAEVLAATRELIRKHYPGVKSERILGHRQVNPGTVCPGDWTIRDNLV